MYALRVNVEGLRPWEYRAMPADEYDMVRHVQAAFEAAKRQYPKGWDRVQRIVPEGR